MAAAPVDLSKIEFPSPFYGDDRDAENGFLFLRELQKAGIIYDDAAHAKVIRIWALTLEGEASAWWNDATIWNGKDKTKIDTVVAEFEKKWPAPSASPKKQHEKMAEFSAVTLSDEEVGRKFIDNQGAESTRHVSFIKELMKKAYAAGDSNVKNLMLPQAIARIPPRLAKAIGDSCVDIQSWDELLTKTEAVSRARIEQVIAEEKKRKDLEERLLKVEGKTPEPTPAPVNNPIDTAERHSAAYSPRPYGAGRFPFVASPARASPRPQTPRPTPPSQSLSDPIAEATPLTNKTIKLTHENTVQGWREYAQAQRDWDEKWGANMLPTAARPYPLQPGGADLAVGCWTCGLDGHYGRDCTTAEANRVPPKEAYWRQTSQAQGRPPAPPRTPVTLRSRAYPGSPMASFPMPPRSPHTPSPPFRRQPPPHVNYVNDAVLMVVDTFGGYHGDLDLQMYGPSAEGEESYSYYPADYYHPGNGSGSNGF